MPRVHPDTGMPLPPSALRGLPDDLAALVAESVAADAVRRTRRMLARVPEAADAAASDWSDRRPADPADGAAGVLELAALETRLKFEPLPPLRPPTRPPLPLLYQPTLRTDGSACEVGFVKPGPDRKDKWTVVAVLPRLPGRPTPEAFRRWAKRAAGVL